jgi:hypothetical protein
MGAPRKNKIFFLRGFSAFNESAFFFILGRVCSKTRVVLEQPRKTKFNRTGEGFYGGREG